MAKKASKTIPLITPFGTLRYPKISEPDTKGEYADNKFKTDMVFSDEDYAAFEAKIKEAAKQLVPEVDVKKLKLPLYTEWTEGKGTRAKTMRRPLVQDGKLNKLPEGVKIGGGTVARLALAVASYKKGANVGINLYLNKVQIRELVEYGAGADFDEDAGGYEHDGSAGASDEQSFDSL